MINKRYGRLSILEESHRDNYSRLYYLCLCECGNKKNVRYDHLKSNKILSCGCYKKELVKNMMKTHGKAASKSYKSWSQMKDRCYNKNNKRYNRYGGRNIFVCDDWKSSFETFYKDMGDPPSIKHSIDRIDNDKGYFKENCRWSTANEQARNRSSNAIIKYNNISRCVLEWCEVFNINSYEYYNKIKQGLKPYDVISYYSERKYE